MQTYFRFNKHLELFFKHLGFGKKNVFLNNILLKFESPCTLRVV